MGFGEDLLEQSASRFGDELLAEPTTVEKPKEELWEPKAPVAVPDDIERFGEEAMAAPVIGEPTKAPQTPQEAMREFAIGDIQEMEQFVEKAAEEVQQIAAYPFREKARKQLAATVEKTADDIAAAGLGAAATAVGFAQIPNDILETLGVDTGDNIAKQAITGLNQKIKEYEDKYNVEGVSWADAGRFIPTLASLGVSTMSKAMVPAIEGLLAYGEQRGVEKEKTEAAITGLLTTTGVFVFGAALDALLPPTAKAVHNYLLSHNKIADDTAEVIFKDYQKVMDVPDTWSNRAKSIVEALGEGGKSIKLHAAASSPEVAEVIKSEMLQRSDLVRRLGNIPKQVRGRKLDKADTLLEFVKAHKKATNSIRGGFTLMKARFPSTPIKNLFVEDALDATSTIVTKINKESAESMISATAREKIGDVVTTTKQVADGAVQKTVKETTKRKLHVPALDEAFVTDRSELLNILKAEEVSPAKLIDAMKVNGRLIFGTKNFTQKNALLALQKELDSTLKQSVDPKLYDHYKALKKQYHYMLNVENHTIGKALKEVREGSVTPYQAFENLSTIRSSEGNPGNIFKHLENIVGPEKSANFEKMVIGDAFTRSTSEGIGDFTDFAKLSDIISRKNFVSKEGKATQELMDIMESSFATDKLLKAVDYRTLHELPIGATLTAKMKFWLVQQVWPAIKQRFPLSKTSKHLAYEKQLFKILGKPGSVKQIQEVLSEMPSWEKELIESKAVKQAGEWIRKEEVKNVTSRTFGVAATKE